MSELSDLKRRAIARVDALADDLVSLAMDIHANPELGFQEYRSSGLLVEALRREGFDVTTGTGGLETAFRAEHGARQGPTIAVLAEYDALPEVGHACGHNLICTAAAGAALAVKAATPELPGRLLVLGTPAEEGGGGKVLMARAGVFEGVDAAMMFHPSSKTMVDRPSLAMRRIKVEFFGKSAHAAAAPEKAVNALEAMIQLFVLVNGLRQHLKKDAVIHGVITDGGKAANVVPAYTSAAFSVRGDDFQSRDAVIAALQRCVDAAALSTGCRGVMTPGMGYDNMVVNRSMAAAFGDNLAVLGLRVEQLEATERYGSTDMGDISQIVPAIHPYLSIAPTSVGGHTVEFAAAAASPEAASAMLNAAKALAMTCLDLFYRPDLLQEARDEFQASLTSGRVRGKVSD